MKDLNISFVYKLFITVINQPEIISFKNLVSDIIIVEIKFCLESLPCHSENSS